MNYLWTNKQQNPFILKNVSAPCWSISKVLKMSFTYSNFYFGLWPKENDLRSCLASLFIHIITYHAMSHFLSFLFKLYFLIRSETTLNCLSLFITGHFLSNYMTRQILSFDFLNQIPRIYRNQSKKKKIDVNWFFFQSNNTK